LDFNIVAAAELCDCQSNNAVAAVEAALFDGADRFNDVCHGDKLFTMEEEEESSSAAAGRSIASIVSNKKCL
jgi:hypothetical protein